MFTYMQAAVTFSWPGDPWPRHCDWSTRHVEHGIGMVWAVEGGMDLLWRCLNGGDLGRFVPWIDGGYW